MTVGRGVPIQQRDTQRVLGHAQCDIVAGSPRRSAPPPRSRAPRSHRPEAPRTVLPNRRSRRRHAAKVVGSLFRAIATASWRSWRHPGRPSHYRAMPRHANATASGEPIPKPAPLAGSPAARSMTVCDHRKRSPNSPASDPVGERYDTPTPWSRWDRRSTRAAPSVRMPAATPHACARRTRARWPARSWRWPATPCPRPRCTTPATPRSGPGFPGLLGLDSRWRTAWCGGRCASTVGRGHRRVVRRRSGGPAPS